MAKPLTVIRKNRFRSLALQPITNTGMRPMLASSDYIVNQIHDGSKEAIKNSRDLYYGVSEKRSAFPQWWSMDISLTFPDPDPEAPRHAKIHYMFQALPACQMSYTVLKRFINRILECLFQKLGRGVGEVYMSIIPGSKLDTYLENEQIIHLPNPPADVDDLWFGEWEVNFVGDELHEVDPATIPGCEKPVQSK